MNDHDRPVGAHASHTDDRGRASHVEAVRQERRRMSRELHDGLAQQLASLGYMLDELAEVDDQAKAAAASASAREQLDDILTTLRATIDRLRAEPASDQPGLGDTGVGPALAAYAREVGRRHGFGVVIGSESTTTTLTASWSSPRLPHAVESELIWIGREAITNAARHAGASTLWLTVDVGPSTVRVVVVDDGTNEAARDRDGGHGVAIMAERAERIGATVHIDDRSGGGTVVTVSMGEAQHDDGARLRTTGR